MTDIEFPVNEEEVPAVLCSEEGAPRMKAQRLGSSVSAQVNKRSSKYVPNRDGKAWCVVELTGRAHAF